MVHGYTRNGRCAIVLIDLEYFMLWPTCTVQHLVVRNICRGTFAWERPCIVSTAWAEIATSKKDELLFQSCCMKLYFMGPVEDTFSHASVFAFKSIVGLSYFSFSPVTRSEKEASFTSDRSMKLIVILAFPPISKE